MSTANTSSPSRKARAPQLVAQADRIARDILNLDPSILSLIVLDTRDGMEVLAVARSPHLPPEAQANPETVRMLATAAVVVWGAAENASRLMGRREFIIGAFREQLVLITTLREHGLLLAIRLNRSSNGEHIYSKIAGLLGLDFADP